MNYAIVQTLFTFQLQNLGIWVMAHQINLQIQYSVTSEKTKFIF